MKNKISAKGNNIRIEEVFKDIQGTNNNELEAYTLIKKNFKSGETNALGITPKFVAVNEKSAKIGAMFEKDLSRFVFERATFSKDGKVTGSVAHNLKVTSEVASFFNGIDNCLRYVFETEAKDRKPKTLFSKSIKTPDFSKSTPNDFQRVTTMQFTYNPAMNATPFILEIENFLAKVPKAGEVDMETKKDAVLLKTFMVEKDVANMKFAMENALREFTIDNTAEHQHLLREREYRRTPRVSEVVIDDSTVDLLASKLLEKLSLEV